MAMTSKIDNAYVRKLTDDELAAFPEAPPFVVEIMPDFILARDPRSSVTIAIADTREEAEAYIDALDLPGLIQRWRDAVVKRRSVVGP